jgi:hypothetical protein
MKPYQDHLSLLCNEIADYPGANLENRKKSREKVGTRQLKGHNRISGIVVSKNCRLT